MLISLVTVSTILNANRGDVFFNKPGDLYLLEKCLSGSVFVDLSAPPPLLSSWLLPLH